jgi:single-strand DNA-binding protein
MNRVELIGNLADEPKLTVMPSGVSVCSFRIAVQRRYANSQGVREADFLPIVAWRQTGELCAKYLSKGRKCGICGSIQTRSYDAKDGGKRYVTEIIADEVHFLGGGQRKQEDAQEPGTGGYAGDDGFTPVDDDELPF